MAKCGSSGGKAGCGYASGKGYASGRAGYSAGKAGSPLYSGRGIGAGKSALPGSPAYFGGNTSYQKGYKIGSDGASLMSGYKFSKDAMERAVGNYMRSASKEGKGLYGSNLADAATMEKLRYMANEPEESAGKCMKCGGPAPKGAPLCLGCMTERAFSYSR